ncbi:MAG: RNA degradosome polyphosphate kinase, partial [Blastocatellia bacterium]
MADIPGGSKLFFNRELSWLAFNERVLEEAANAANPLLERVKFATIVASNLDEFFMVRVAALKHAVQHGDERPDPSDMTPVDQLAAISDRAHVMVMSLERLIMGALLPAMAEHGVLLTTVAALDHVARAAIAAYFRDEVLPVLTPLAIDVARPFPMLSSLSVNLAFVLAPQSGTGDRRLAIVQVPLKLPRLVRIAGAPTPTFVLLDEIVRAEPEALFPGQTLLESAAFRLTRDSELELDTEGGESYVEAVEQVVRQRRRSAVIRMEIENSASGELRDWLA